MANEIARDSIWRLRGETRFVKVKRSGGAFVTIRDCDADGMNEDIRATQRVSASWFLANFQAA